MQLPLGLFLGGTKEVERTLNIKMNVAPEKMLI